MLDYPSPPNMSTTHICSKTQNMSLMLCPSEELCIMSHVFQWTWIFPEFHLDLRPCVQVELYIERLSFLVLLRW